MSKTRWFVFTMLHPILCRIFYHQITETALLVACGHMESLMETKSCYLAWRIWTDSIRALLPSEQAERRCMPMCNAEQAACRTRHCCRHLWIPRVAVTWWHYQSLTAKNSQSLTLTCLPCHCIPFLSLFLKFFWFWSPPLALWHVLPSVHADGAIQRSQKVWCPQIPLDSVGLYHRAVGKTNGKLENTFQSTEQSRLM